MLAVAKRESIWEASESEPGWRGAGPHARDVRVGISVSAGFLLQRGSSLGVGQAPNLQFCHLLVNFDLPWNPMLIEQRIGRVHR
jgi:hypothetical protein